MCGTVLTHPLCFHGVVHKLEKSLFVCVCVLACVHVGFFYSNVLLHLTGWNI